MDDFEFLNHLEGYALNDITPRDTQLVRLWRICGFRVPRSSTMLRTLFLRRPMEHIEIARAVLVAQAKRRVLE